MSVIVTFCLYDGIVMAADSRTTLTKSYPDGRQEVSHKDGIKKNFQFGDRDYLEGLFNRLSWIATIKEIAERINEECNERVQGETIRCHIAGYENGVQCFY